MVSVQIPQKSRISQFKISISNYYQILNSVSTFDVKTKNVNMTKAGNQCGCDCVCDCVCVCDMLF